MLSLSTLMIIFIRTNIIDSVLFQNYYLVLSIVFTVCFNFVTLLLIEFMGEALGSLFSDG